MKTKRENALLIKWILENRDLLSSPKTTWLERCEKASKHIGTIVSVENIRSRANDIDIAVFDANDKPSKNIELALIKRQIQYLFDQFDMDITKVE